MVLPSGRTFDMSDVWDIVRPKVNEALARVPVKVPRTGCADSNGLGDKGDATHFTSEALVEFGKRYAVEMLKLSRRN